MKLIPLRPLTSALFGLVLTAAPALAVTDDTAHHRSVYSSINAQEGALKRSTATFKDDPVVFHLQGWSDSQGLRKIVSGTPGEDGGGSEEYYLENGEVLFVFSTYRDSAGKKVENRFYFRDSKLFKWIGTDKKTVAASSPDFQAESERLSSNFCNFVTALKGKGGSSKGGSSSKAAPAFHASTGTFTGIEEGDYSHWLMRTDSGEELSLFILNPTASVDKVIASPKQYKGRKCRVQWEESMENIPEAGGRIKVQQILNVEWLGKK